MFEVTFSLFAVCFHVALERWSQHHPILGLQWRRHPQSPPTWTWRRCRSLRGVHATHEGTLTSTLAVTPTLTLILGLTLTATLTLRTLTLTLTRMKEKFDIIGTDDEKWISNVVPVGSATLFNTGHIHRGPGNVSGNCNTPRRVLFVAFTQVEDICENEVITQENFEPRWRTRSHIQLSPRLQSSHSPSHSMQGSARPAGSSQRRSAAFRDRARRASTDQAPTSASLTSRLNLNGSMPCTVTRKLSRR